MTFWQSVIVGLGVVFIADLPFAIWIGRALKRLAAPVSEEQISSAVGRQEEES
jgi:hypothetical protein